HCGGPHETCQCDQLIFDEPYCKNCGGPHMNFQCQPMNQNHYEPNPCYDSNSFGFDQFQPSLFPVIHQPIHEKTYAELLAEEQEANIDTQPFKYSIVPQPPQEEMSVEFLQEKRNQMEYVKTFLRKFNRISFYEMPKVLSLAWEKILEIKLAFEDKHCHPEDILELFQRLHNDVQNIHEELVVYINTPNWDRPTIYYDDDDEDYAIAVTPTLKDNPAPSSDFMTKSSSTSLNSLLEETNTFDNSLPELETFCFDLEEISSGSTTTHSDSSLYDSFIFDLSINPPPPTDRGDFYEFSDKLAHIISPPEYDCFCFKNEPNSVDFTMDVVEDTFPTREPRVHDALPTHLPFQLNLDFILSSETLFAYVIWIFLPFLSYSIAP
nr:hypothetical protein [Tanacetum cinerariifolium]